MKTLNFVAVILKVLLVNLLAALNFANVFLEIKNVWKIINVKKRKKRFYIYGFRHSGFLPPIPHCVVRKFG